MFGVHGLGRVPLRLAGFEPSIHFSTKEHLAPRPERYWLWMAFPLDQYREAVFADPVFSHEGAGSDADFRVVWVVIQGRLRSLTEALRAPIEPKGDQSERGN